MKEEELVKLVEGMRAKRDELKTKASFCAKHDFKKESEFLYPLISCLTESILGIEDIMKGDNFTGFYLHL